MNNESNNNRQALAIYNPASADLQDVRWWYQEGQSHLRRSCWSGRNQTKKRLNQRMCKPRGQVGEEVGIWRKKSDVFAKMLVMLLGGRRRRCEWDRGGLISTAARVVACVRVFAHGRFRSIASSRPSPSNHPFSQCPASETDQCRWSGTEEAPLGRVPNRHCRPR